MNDKRKRLYDAITNVPDDLVAEARQTPLRRAPRAWVKWGAAAACIVAVLVLAAVWPRTPGGQNGTFSLDALAAVTLPEAYDFDDYEARRATRDNNAVSTSFVNALNKFSFETTAALLAADEGNANYSPLSLYYALAMAATGAEGQTEQALLTLLGMPDRKTLSAQCGNMFRLIYKNNEIGKLTLANSMWMDSGITWKDAFIQNAADHFYAEVFSVDFADAQTGPAMGQWIANQTNGLLAPDIALDPATILTLINTVYFKDEWGTHFEESLTAPDKFTLADGTTMTCDFMNRESWMGSYVRGDSFLRAGIPLKNGGTMLFVLPDEGISPRDLLADPTRMKEALFDGIEKSSKVLWKVPKFSFETSYDLRDMLITLGAGEAFSVEANFTNITEKPTFISGVKQETHIGIDEKGVEAAAYTQIDYAGGGAPDEWAQMILDRPFLYGITSPEGTLLFVGICENPACE